MKRLILLFFVLTCASFSLTGQEVTDYLVTSNDVTINFDVVKGDKCKISKVLVSMDGGNTWVVAQDLEGDYQKTIKPGSYTIVWYFRNAYPAGLLSSNLKFRLESEKVYSADTKFYLFGTRVANYLSDMDCYFLVMPATSYTFTSKSWMHGGLVAMNFDHYDTGFIAGPYFKYLWTVKHPSAISGATEVSHADYLGAQGRSWMSGKMFCFGAMIGFLYVGAGYGERYYYRDTETPMGTTTIMDMDISGKQWGADVGVQIPLGRFRICAGSSILFKGKVRADITAGLGFAF